MRGSAEDVATAAVAPAGQPAPPAENAEKEKKRPKRRSNRRPKQKAILADGYAEGVERQKDGDTTDVPSSSGAGSSSDGSSHLSVSCDVRAPLTASEVSFCSMPNIQIEEGRDKLAARGEVPPMIPPTFLLSNTRISKSCPVPGPSPEDRSRRLFLGCRAPEYFEPHWSKEAVNQALEKGRAFRVVLRVNAYNRLEAYCTVEGVPVDVLINGSAAQNRASSLPRNCSELIDMMLHFFEDWNESNPWEDEYNVAGDVVAIMLDPVEVWTRLKNSVNQPSNSVPAVASNESSEVNEVNAGDEKDANIVGRCSVPLFDKNCDHHDFGFNKPTSSCLRSGSGGDGYLGVGNQPCSLGTSNTEGVEAARSVRQICALISNYPSKRPTGRVLAIVEPSSRRNVVVGYLSCKMIDDGKMSNKNEIGRHLSSKEQASAQPSCLATLHLTPTDPRFPEMMVSVSSLPDIIKDKLKANDASVEKELLAARIEYWTEEDLLPHAHVTHVFGHGGETEAQVAAVLFENAICDAEFSLESLSCLPVVPWKIPAEEFDKRRDLRDVCTFTIDPSSAMELDDSLSVEKISDDVYRVGVHIADVSFFVQPGTTLDMEAQGRSTSVYILQRKLPMLPSLLSEKLVSLLPSEDKLALSIIWDITLSGYVVRQWVGRSIIRSCCKLSYEHAQKIIDEDDSWTSFPSLHDQFGSKDLADAIRTLNMISRKLKEIRFQNGALWLDDANLELLFDEFGKPYDGVLRHRTDSYFLVEEFMLLANRTAARIISRAFPECALLRRHPEPNLRKLKEFVAFCTKCGFEVDTSSSGQLHLSLVKISELLKDDPVFFDILISYASKPMQLATYICTGDFVNREDNWAHYALGVPQYTHFTSPLRRYPDILVHRTLLAAVDAEKTYMRQTKLLFGITKEEEFDIFMNGCFTGISFDKAAAESNDGKEALNSAVIKYKVPRATELSEIVAYCNERQSASRQAKDAVTKVYLWALLRRKKSLTSDGRVVGLGSKFISVYINKFGLERRVYLGDVEGLTVEWLENTSTLVLDLQKNKCPLRRGLTARSVTLEETALVTNPCEAVHDCRYTEIESSCAMEAQNKEVDPAVFPMRLHLLSTIPVVLHPTGGDDGAGAPNVGVRLYTISYFAK